MSSGSQHIPIMPEDTLSSGAHVVKFNTLFQGVDALTENLITQMQGLQSAGTGVSLRQMLQLQQAQNTLSTFTSISSETISALYSSLSKMASNLRVS